MISKIQKHNTHSVLNSGELFPIVATKREIKTNLHLITRQLVRRLIKLANYPNSEKCRDIQDLQYECYRQAVKEYTEAVFFRF